MSCYSYSQFHDSGMNSSAETPFSNKDSDHEAESVALITMTAFVGFLPYGSLLYFLYMTRKTDNRQPHSPIQNTLVSLSSVCIFGSLILSVLALALLYSQPTMISKDELLTGFPTALYKLCKNVLLDGPSVIATSYYYMLLLTAFQRAVLIMRAKLGMRLLTGRRLKFEIALLLILALISSINKIVDPRKTPWLEIITLFVTLSTFLFCAFMVQHIERRMIATAHITVLTQTVPLALFMSVFTIGDFYVLSSDQTSITPRTFRIITAIFMSFITPFFLLMGSWAKRSIANSLITCTYEQQRGRGELYSADRTPVDTSNAVSMIPIPIG